ncbi:(deoxy)nucleoside triphosphate pyrophosphohydrolase [Myxococcota bacterium]|nr:(deoxy)nucleoside triphosphate pyrophosphohydrolase [Myxococcota bacterium]
MEKRLIRVVSAAIIREKKYLITQRQEKAVLPLLWEFPGGKVEEGESDEVALKRELYERLLVDAEIKQLISKGQKEYKNYIVEMHLYACDIADQEVQKGNVNDLRWLCSSEFDDYEFTPADEESMDALLFGTNPVC